MPDSPSAQKDKNHTKVDGLCKNSCQASTRCFKLQIISAQIHVVVFSIFDKYKNQWQQQPSYDINPTEGGEPDIQLSMKAA